MKRSDYEYYLRRERQERAHLERCADSTARYAHQELADRYTEKLRQIEPAD